MHESAIKSFELFNKTYLNSPENLHVIEIGSQNVNSSVKELIDKNFKYIGVDIAPGDNVDIVLKDPYKFPIDDNSIDVVISISTFEHVDFFWLTFLEILRVLKKDGLLITYTPDWETQFKNFYDDETHVKPYTTISLKQTHLKHGYNFLFTEKFYQLPITWKYPIVKLFCKLIALMTPIRSKNKFLRFSKELMILSVGKK